MNTNASPRVPLESNFAALDGARLHYRHWPARGVSGKALVLFHRGHEHSGRWQETVDALGLEDCHVFAWDARGHGASPGERGSARDIGVLISDVDAFVAHIRDTHHIATEDMVVVAHSVGAVVAAAWVHDYAPKIRGLVLATPALRVKLYVPFAVPMLRLKQAVFGHGYVRSYVKSHMLTHDKEQARIHAADTQIFREIAVNILLDLHDTGARLAEDSGAIQVPTLMFSGGADWVVDNAIQERFMRNLGSADKTLVMLPGFHHAVFHESERHIVVAQIRHFAQRLFAAPCQKPQGLVEADKAGYAKDEYERLLGEPKRLRSVARRLVFGTLGRLSRGIRLGHRAGFDSGEMLDYVYENEPRGFPVIGKAFDKAYLDSPGWTGIRVRRANLEQLLGEAIDRQAKAGLKPHILDSACGGGRYVLETMAARKSSGVSAVLRDYRQQNLDKARSNRDALGVKDVELVLGNAFDTSSYADDVQRPTIGIISGLLELFPSNEPAKTLLGIYAQQLPAGSVLIYTNQPWHPQLEFIAGVLRNREGQPWVMRRRTQAEMDALVEAAGFEKIVQRSDQWGIFTVSVALRKASA